MESVSVFDLCLILFCCFGLCLATGAAYGRASVWREIALREEPDEPEPPKQKDVPAHAHREDRRPPEVGAAHGLHGAGEAKVVARRPREQRER